MIFLQYTLIESLLFTLKKGLSCYLQGLRIRDSKQRIAEVQELRRGSSTFESR